MLSLPLQVLVRAVLGVSANALQKRWVMGDRPIVRLWWWTHIWMLPPALLLALLGTRPTDGAFWLQALAAGGLDALGNLAMMQALRSTDLSVFGPLNALRPLLALAFGWLFLGELPSALGGLGVALTVVGAAVLLGGPARPWGNPAQSADPQRVPSVWAVIGWRVLGLGLSAVGAVYLKRAVGTGTAGWTLAVWVATGGVVIGALALWQWVRAGRGKAPAPASAAAGIRPAVGGWRGPEGWRVPLHAVLFLGMQGLTIQIFQQALLAYAFVFFQLGMVLQVIVGRIWFQEGGFGRRLTATLVMAVGAGLILWRG